MSSNATHRHARRSRGPLLGALAAATLAGCIYPFGGRRGGDDAADGGKPDTTPVVRIREFAGSARTSVLAWSHDEAHVGLRAEVRRDDGTLVGASQRGDHVVFLATSYVSTMGGFMRASVPPNPLVLRTSRATDDLACYRARGTQCSPLTTVRLSVPDSILRMPGDSLVVSFYSDWAKPWTVALRRDLVDTYLRVVDSVSAERRARVSARSP